MTYWTESIPAMTTEERVQYIYNRLRAKNLTDTEARAMLANIEVETGGSFDPAQLQKGSRKDPAFGLFQFDPRGLGLAKPYLSMLRAEKTKIHIQLITRLTLWQSLSLVNMLRVLSTSVRETLLNSVKQRKRD